MDLSDLVAPAAVFAGVACRTKGAALRHLAAQSERLWSVPADAALGALLAREKMGATGFGGGVAIPHGRVAGLDRMVAAVLRPAQPIDWEAMDGQPVALVAMLLGPADPEVAGAMHLKALARVSRALRDRALVAKLCGARDAAAMWTLLCADEQTVAA